MRRKALILAALLPFNFLYAAGSGSVSSDINGILSSMLLPLFAACCVIGVVSGLAKNWELITDRNSDQKKQGLINVVIFALYGVLAATIVTFVMQSVTGISLSI